MVIQWVVHLHCQFSRILRASSSSGNLSHEKKTFFWSYPARESRRSPGWITFCSQPFGICRSGSVFFVLPGKSQGAEAGWSRLKPKTSPNVWRNRVQAHVWKMETERWAEEKMVRELHVVMGGSWSGWASGIIVSQYPRGTNECLKTVLNCFCGFKMYICVCIYLYIYIYT